MSEFVTQLASLEVSNEMINMVDLHEISRNFKTNYGKLDDLKKFRSEYEKKNWLGRLWHRGDLRDAQMDATQVQADFSKSIGQLMMISIMQSKMLSSQQTILNEQQSGLKAQADHIEMHANDLAAQHLVLKEQSERLENLVKDYFALKGLTDKGAEALIQIAKEVKGTKSDMLAKFDEHVTDLQALCSRLSSQVDERVAQVDSQMQAATMKIEMAFRSFQQDAEVARQDLTSTMRRESEGLRQELGKAVDAHREGTDERLAQVAAQVKLVVEKADSEFITLRQEGEIARQDLASAIQQKHEVMRQEVGTVIDSHHEKIVRLSCRADEQMEGLSQHAAKIEALREQMDTQKATSKRLSWAIGLGTIVSIALFAWVLMAYRGR